MSARLLAMTAFLLLVKGAVVSGNFASSLSNKLVPQSIDLYTSCHGTVREKVCAAKETVDAKYTAVVGYPTESVGHSYCLQVLLVVHQSLPIGPKQTKLCTARFQPCQLKKDGVYFGSREKIAIIAFQNLLMPNATKKLSCIAETSSNRNIRIVTFGQGLVKVLDLHMGNPKQRGKRPTGGMPSENLKFIRCRVDYESCNVLKERIKTETEHFWVSVLAVMFALDFIIFVVLISYVVSSRLL